MQVLFKHEYFEGHPLAEPSIAKTRRLLGVVIPFWAGVCCCSLLSFFFFSTGAANTASIVNWSAEAAATACSSGSVLCVRRHHKWQCSGVGSGKLTDGLSGVKTVFNHLCK
jgi:hypothetical protein